MVNYSVWQILIIVSIVYVKSETDEPKSDQLFKIEGKISVPYAMEQEWVANTRVLVDGGKYIGFLRFVYNIIG